MDVSDCAAQNPTEAAYNFHSYARHRFIVSRGLACCFVAPHRAHNALAGAKASSARRRRRSADAPKSTMMSAYPTYNSVHSSVVDCSSNSTPVSVDCSAPRTLPSGCYANSYAPDVNIKSVSNTYTEGTNTSKTVSFQYNNEVYSNSVEPETASSPRLVFLDLDNTLIPTAWMMEQWRLSGPDTARTVRAINRHLVAAGLFDVLDRLFDALVNTSPQRQRVVIVTNAVGRTVRGFYLTYCLPQLKQLVEKYRIPIRSTECWLPSCGPIPLPHQDEALRELYTTIKLRQFQEELRVFERELRTTNSLRANRHEWKLQSSVPAELGCPAIDVISVGDQLCEITAAIRLGALNPSLIRRTKLLMILDFARDRFLTTSPEYFVRRLQETHLTLLYVLGLKTRTVISRFPVRGAELKRHNGTLGELKGVGTEKSTSSFNALKRCVSNYRSDDAAPRLFFSDDSEGEDISYNSGQLRCAKPPSDTAVWILKSVNLAFCVGRPQDFNAKDWCPRVRMTLSHLFNQNKAVAAPYKPKRMQKTEPEEFWGLTAHNYGVDVCQEKAGSAKCLTSYARPHRSLIDASLYDAKHAASCRRSRSNSSGTVQRYDTESTAIGSVSSSSS